MVLLDRLISAVSALKDYLETLRPPPDVRPLVAPSSAPPLAFTVPLLSFDVVVPAVIASRLGRRGVLAVLFLVFAALLTRLVAAVRIRDSGRNQRIAYRPAAQDDGSRHGAQSPRGRSPSPREAAPPLRPTVITSFNSLASADTAQLILGEEGTEKLLQAQDGRMYVAVQSQGFVRVWDADDRGRPISREQSLDASSLHVDPQQVEEQCEQLLRHFSEREVAESLARQPSESSGGFLQQMPRTDNQSSKKE
jgi:hypothetical protein